MKSLSTLSVAAVLVASACARADEPPLRDGRWEVSRFDTATGHKFATLKHVLKSNGNELQDEKNGLTPVEAATLRARLLEAAKTNKPLTITPKVGVGPIKFGMSAAEVEAALGKPFRTTGRAKEYQHLGLAVLFNKQDQVAAIMVGAWCEASDILLDVFKGGTESGVRLRADREQVVKAYGEPSAVRTVGLPEAEFEVLEYDALRAAFALRKGKLVHVTLKRSAGR